MLMFSQLQAVAGLAADGRQIVARAKSEATNYERFLFFHGNFNYGHIFLPLNLSLCIYLSFYFLLLCVLAGMPHRYYI